MSRSQGLIWLALQLAVAAAGAAGALFSALAGVATLLLAFPLALFSLKKGWDSRAEDQPNKQLGDGIAAAGIGLFLLLLFSAGLMQALGVLLMMATFALNVQLNNYRKFYLLQLVTFVLLLVGAAEATSGSYLLVMSAYCLFAAFSLSEAWLDQGEHAALINGPSFSQRALISGVVMGIALVIYLLMPRFAALNWGGQQSSSGDFYHDSKWEQGADESVSEPYKKPAKPQNSSEAQYDQLKEITDLSDFNDGDYRYDGFNEQFDVRDTERGGAVDLNAIVARMQASHGTYLKVRTFDTFDGVSWSTANEDITRKIKTSGSGRADINRQREGNFQQIITIEQPMPAWLPAAADPVTLWVPASAIALDQFAQPLLPGPLKKGTRYTVNSALELLDNRLLSHAPAADKSDLQLPKGFDKKIQQLAQQVTKNQISAYDKAVALEEHLRSSYAYSFASITRSQGQTPLSEFLFKTKEGHCEYFASAMTIMLRSLKIPARLVTGFSVTTRNPLTGYFEIRAIDGHAWTEAWIDGRWVTFEPTAYYQLPAPQENLLAAEQISDYAQELLRRNQTTGEGGWTLMGVLSSLWLLISTLVVVVLASIKFVLWTLWPVFAVLLVLAGIGWFTRHLWWAEAVARFSLWKIKRYQPQDSGSALQFYLYHLQRIGARQTGERQPDELLAEWLPPLAAQKSAADEARAFITASDGYLYEGQALDAQRLQQLVLALCQKLA